LYAIGEENIQHFYRKVAHGIFFAPSCRGNIIINNKVRFYLNRLKDVLTGRKESIEEREAKADARDIIETAQKTKADVIWLGFGNISYLLLKHIKQHSGLPVVVDTDSVWSRYVLRGLPFAKDEEERKRIEEEGRQKEEQEQWGTKMADITTAVSEVDAEYYRGLARTVSRVHIFSNVIDIEKYKPTSPPDGYKTLSIFLAGTFWPGSPMDIAARWMIREVLPLVKRDIPEIHFYIAGKDSESVLADVKDDNVSVIGTVPSVLPYLCNAAVSVVPLHFESGTRFKILEAGACVVPVVSTTLGAEGIPAVHGKDIIIADTPEEFSEGVIRMIKDRGFAHELAHNLRQLVMDHYTVEALAQEGKEILSFLMR
jgi:glycosyltransferase involved in cell wall biosynthesis